MDLSDFDRYVDEQEAAGNTDPVPVLFAQWLANISDKPIIATKGGDTSPSFAVVPQ